MSGEIRVTADVGGRPLTLDPIRVIPVELEVREVESTIPCGFQSVWGEGEVDGQEFTLAVGAGFGSRWATIHYHGKNYCFSANGLMEAFFKALEGPSELDNVKADLSTVEEAVDALAERINAAGLP